MTLLQKGDINPNVKVLQLALKRAGFFEGEFTKVFDTKTETAVKNFQKSKGLSPNGVAGSVVHRMLMPHYLGYTNHVLKKGDSFYNLASQYNTTISAIETANPEISPMNLRQGISLIIPYGYELIPTDIEYTSTLISFCVRGLVTRYPFLRLSEMGKTVMGKPIYYLTAGEGDNRVFFGGSFHANEWITTPVLLKFTEDLSKSYTENKLICNINPSQIFARSTIYIAPAINPDGIDLVTGALTEGNFYNNAKQIAENYEDIPFPDGWKANISGVDLNLQFPAEWEKARQIKFSQGYVSPAPRDYVGASPLSARESRAVFEFTKQIDPRLILAYHTQGEVIFWKYLDYEPLGSRVIAEILSKASGYAVLETPYGSSFAGYKDWFIEYYDRPAYTIEAGLGQNPLPITQFDKIYKDNKCLLTTATIV